LRGIAFDRRSEKGQSGLHVVGVALALAHDRVFPHEQYVELPGLGTSHFNKQVGAAHSLAAMRTRPK